jgi:hypothetical protein
MPRRNEVWRATAIRVIVRTGSKAVTQGALPQVGWEAVFGFRRSERLKRAASASRQAELRANFVKLRAGLTHNGSHNGDKNGD